MDALRNLFITAELLHFTQKRGVPLLVCVLVTHGGQTAAQPCVIGEALSETLKLLKHLKIGKHTKTEVKSELIPF